jgi:TonB-dependent receptor
MKNTRALHRTPVAQAISLVLGTTLLGSALAQDAAANAAAEQIDEIVVTGIRGSLTSSMNLKKSGQGVMDGIVAEDIGKFPDTNLAESLQRISGVSIDRTAGEGSRITVRGVGPDFNLVLLNGRQMPGVSIGVASASNSRAFDFADLASEAVSAVEVYKTSRAAIATGGIGATVNIRTARPFDNEGTVFNLGVKGVMDLSAGNLPSNIEGSTITPELSGIYSQTSEDGTFGVALTASYQVREAGFNNAAVNNGWRTFRANQPADWGTIPLPGQPGSEDITNRPDGDDIYSVPQNLNYNFNSIERTRTNGQLTFQWKPADALTTTLDYTYSENRTLTRRNELSVWFNFGPTTSTWTDGPNASPLVYTEHIPAAANDLSMGGAEFATRNATGSVGLNLEWQVNDRLWLELDHHHSNARSGADSPFGSNSILGVASFDRGDTTVDFSRDLPVVSVVLPAGQSGISSSLMQVTGSSFRNSLTDAEVGQSQLTGKFMFAEDSALDFGASLTEVNNRSAFAAVDSNNTWGGIPGITPANYSDDLWLTQDLRGFFDQVDGADNPALFDQFFSWDFRAVRQIVADARGALGGAVASCPLNGNEASLVPCYEASSRWGTDRRTREESTSAFVQYTTRFDLAMPIDLAVGLRYEETDVTSSALVPIATGINWTGNNEFPVQFGAPDFTTLTGSYDYLLPSADLAFNVRDDLKLRVSYGESIGRPGWGDIQGGQTLNPLARIDGGGGAQGDPGLKPLLSRNYDVSAEWYYDDASYLSIGYFKKDIDNYIGTSQIDATPFNLPHPGIGSGYYTEAVTTGGCNAGNLTCIRNYIFLNHDGDPGVVRGPDNPQGNQTGVISGIPGDPLATFLITVPANQRSAKLDGWEIAVQHLFGDTGFGVTANATLVDSDLEYDDHNLGEQFALEGLSDSANLVAFFENRQWSVRAAYNWRDKFLISRFDALGPNPIYVSAYGQLDMNVGYAVNDNLSFAVEAINLLDETARLHGRNEKQTVVATQTGTRYMIGARYKF